MKRITSCIIANKSQSVHCTSWLLSLQIKILYCCLIQLAFASWRMNLATQPTIGVYRICKKIILEKRFVIYKKMINKDRTEPTQA